MATPNYTVTGTLDNLIGGMDANGYLIFTLVNYGSDVPRVSGTSIVVQPATKVVAANGTFSATLWGNDQITPGGNLLPTQTYYTVEIFSDTGQKLQAAAYRFVGTGSFDLSTQVPLSSSPVVIPPTGLPVFVPVVDKFLTGFDGQQYFASSIGSTRFVEQFTNIQAAITDAGTTGNVLIPSAYAGTDVYTNPNNIQIHDLRGKPDRDRTFVNALVDCGLKGDGVTNDGPAIQACIDANQGKRIVFPKTQAVGSCDYSIGSTTIQPKGHGQIIEGQGAGWAGEGTRFCKLVADGNTAIDTIHANCQNCAIKNIHLTGPQIWTSVTLTQNIPPCNPPNGQNYPAGIVCDATASDGLLVEAGFITLENVYVENFGRNGIVITSNFGGFPDNFNLINVTSNNNRGDGMYTKGGDVNAGSSLQFHAYNNMMYGLDDQGFLGNTHYSPQVTGNHPAGTTTGSTFSITAASRAANVVTLTAAGHNVSLGNVVVVAGVTDGTFNGTFSISSVTANTITYAQTAGNASSAGGTVRLTSNNEFYAATGIVGGSYNESGLAATNLLVAPYCEGGQNPITGTSHLTIIGGTIGCGIDYTNSPLVVGNSVAGSPVAGANFLTGSAGFSFLSRSDAGGLLMNWVGGNTIDTSIEHRFMGNSLTTYWDWVHNVGPANGQTLSLYRGGNGSHLRFQAGGPGVGGLNQFNDEGTSTRFNNQTGSSGNIEFYSAGGGQIIHDFLSSGQYAMTPSANNIDILSLKRFTDTSPTGNFLNFKNAAGSSLFNVDITGTPTAPSYIQSNDASRVDSRGVALNSIKVVGWTGSSSSGAALNTGLSEIAAGIIGVGNGAQGDFSGLLKADRLNAVSGIFFNSAGPTGHVLRGNGTFFVDAQLAAGDLSNGTTGSGSVVLNTAPTLTTMSLAPTANGVDMLVATRFTNTSPTGTFVRFNDAVGAPLYEIDTTGKPSLQQGIPTVGIGTPLVVATTSQLSQTASIGITALLTSAPVGLYRLTKYFASTTACATPGPATVVLSQIWASENANEVANVQSLALGGNSAGNTTGGTLSTTTDTFWQNSIGNISYSTTYTACTSGTGTYNLWLVLERIN